MRLRRLVPLGLGAMLLPVWAFPPKPQDVDAPDTVGEIVAECQASGLTGRELVDDAIKRVARSYPWYSLRRLIASPSRSLKEHCGWSHQYNLILLAVLQQLGFTARAVHAPRVRGFRRPWWLAGHTWVKVRVDGHELDACASTEASRVGKPPFVPLTHTVPFRSVTNWAVSAALIPFVTVEVWRSWLTRRPIPPWIHGPKPTARIDADPLG